MQTKEQKKWGRPGNEAMLTWNEFHVTNEAHSSQALPEVHVIHYQRLLLSVT